MEAEGEATRIYVGGLGAGVTDDDLRKTFSALGEVLSVDIVRTKARSFAYLDFLPSSAKSLPKLFSTYNGCMWKGGKLRLEKAKENYLLRLRREWQEETDHANKASNTCNESHDTSEKPKKTSMADKMQLGQLRIFFPRLQKVKSLASVGIGKHKYSFQRAEVPSIPTHFCDCEEHERPFLTTNKKQSSEFEDASGGINEQELNIMKSVMNKIFERENPSKQVNETGVSIKSNDEFLADESDEEDNLIINVANGKSDSMDLLGEMRSMMANREPVANRLRSSSEKPKNVKKKPRSEENNSKVKKICETARNSQTHLNTVEDSKKQLGSNSLRSLKSTWKDLIGQTPFSISDIIATVAQEKEEDITKNVENTPKKKKRKVDIVENDIDPSGSDQKETTISEQFSISDVLPEQKEDHSDVFPEQNDHSDVLPVQKEDHSDILPKQKDHSDPEQEDHYDVLPERKEEDDDMENKSLDKQENAQDLIRTARGDAWRHKFSWTQLISNTSDTPFTISQVVPNLSFEKRPQQQVDNHRSPAVLLTEQQMVSEKSNANLTSSSPAKKRILSLGNLESDEICPFMRTEESIKEWNKAKTSLNKKKSLNASK